MYEWCFKIESGSAGTFRRAVRSQSHWEVNYNEKGEVIWNNLPTGWKVPTWPGDDKVSRTSYSFGFHA